MTMTPEQIAKDRAEIEKTAKLQAEFDKKLKVEVDALLDEAKKNKIEVPNGTRNPEAIRKHIDEVLAKRKKADTKE